MRLKEQNTKHYNIFIILLIIASFILTSCGTKSQQNYYKHNITTTPKRTVEIKKPEPEKIEAVINFTGDLMVHSYQYNESYNTQTKEYEFDHNFEAIKKYFESADYTIGNLETVLGGEGIGAQDYPRFNTPDSFALAAKNAGFSFFTTANNHCVDQGTDALCRTLDVLDSLGIKHTGTSRSQEEYEKIEITDIKGIKFVFLSYTYGTNGIPFKNSYNVNILDEEKVVNDIKKAKELKPDFIIVMPHMGTEYQTQPNDSQKNWADIMFNAGADIIVASHPHVLQPMEMREITLSDGSIKTGYIMYSMGNFISSQTTPPRNASIILNIHFVKTNKTAQISKISFIPIWTQFRNLSNTNNFVVRSIYDVLKEPEKYRKKDLSRVKDIHFETTSLLLNKNIPIEDIQEEYTFYSLQ